MKTASRVGWVLSSVTLDEKSIGYPSYMYLQRSLQVTDLPMLWSSLWH